jgi:predicted RNase H-like nuclease (RuvC/YqgF family)
MNIFNKIGSAISGTAVSAGSNLALSAQVKKCELDLAQVESRFTDSYIIIGKRVSEFLRAGDEMDDPKIKEAFGRISKLDTEKSELEHRLKELKGTIAGVDEAADLIAMEADIEKDISKYKKLLDMGVDSQEEYDRKVAMLRNKANNFKKLRALDLALSKGLISPEDFKIKKAMILGQNVVE